MRHEPRPIAPAASSPAAAVMAASGMAPLGGLRAPPIARPRLRGRRRLRLSAAASAALHALLLAVLLISFQGQPQWAQDVSRGQSVDVVYEGGAQHSETSSSTPASAAAPAPRVNVFQDQPEPETLLPDQGSVLLPAPPPHPPRPRAQRRTAPANPFAAVQNYSFAGASTGAPQQTPARGLSLSLAPVIRGGQLLDPVTHVASATASGDWRRQVEDWIESHKYYPRQAAENGEDGTTTVVARIDRNGKVLGVRVAGSSGSRWLDLATMAIFRDQKLPPFPDDMPDKDVEVTLDMHYLLQRR